MSRRRMLQDGVRQPVAIMSVCLLAAGLLRFAELRVFGFTTWQFVLALGGAYWLLRTLGIRTWVRPLDMMVIPIGYLLAGLLVGTYPSPTFAVYLSWYYSLLMPILSPLVSRLAGTSLPRFRQR